MIKKLLFLTLAVFTNYSLHSQCAAYTTNTACTTAAPVNATPITCTPPNANGGRRNFVVTNMIAGATYRVSNCGSGLDTQMTIRDTGGTVVGYNDDNGPACLGTAASIDFVPPATGDYRIQMNRYNCDTVNGSVGTITVTLTAAPPTVYCTPSSTDSAYYIDDFLTTSGAANITHNGSGFSTAGYGDFTGMNVSQIAGSSFNFSTTHVGGTFETNIWVDWNNDFTFANAGVEKVFASIGYLDTQTGTITVPPGTPPGNYTMRVRSDWSTADPSPCGFDDRSETHDYTVTVFTPGPCTTPTAQPTSLTFGTVSSTTIDGSFTASVPTASNYLVLMNTTGTTPTTPVDGTTYAIGTTPLGATVIDNDTNLSFSATGLTANTTYYFFIYAFNDSGCTGGPLYNTINPLIGNEITDFYCTPSSTDTTNYIDDFITTGAITNINHTGTGFSTNGYGNFSAMNIEQLQGSNIDFTINFVGGTYETNIWVDWNSDGDFVDVGEKVFETAGYSDPTTGSFTVPGVAGGSYRMRVRSDWFNGDPSPCGYDDDSETHDYTLIVTPLNCTANPQSLTAISTTTTTATVSWNAPTPAPGNGYEYIISTDNTITTPAGDITGTTTGTSINLTGLTPNTTYYVFVRGVCNATDNGLWNAVVFNTGCADLDDTPNSCEMIIGENGVDPFAITPFDLDPSFTLDCNTTSIDLATNAQMYETTSYDVIKIPYQYIPAFGATISNSTIANDDYWATTPTNIGFPFCFYDDTKTDVLLGANSIITFEWDNITTNFTPTPGEGSGFQIDTNLPSLGTGTGIFRNAIYEQAIYGVYHDIDPTSLPASAITTRNQGVVGCRKFIAEWKDVPMFSDATRLYSGMIVLYETTNIIEVYIEEKRIDNNNVSPWNDGNAIVGIQGDYVGPATNPANEYAVAPCRNGLDTNWEITNEAWRFVPSGASRLAGVEWYIGTDTSGAPDATTNTYTATVAGTYTAVSTYSTCDGSTVTLTDEVIITNGSKTWNGSVDDNWYIANNWTPTGVPNSGDCVVVPATAVSNGNAPIADIFNLIPLPPSPALARNLTLLPNSYLEVGTNTELIVQEWVTVQNTGILNLKSSSSLIQVDDSAVNTGNIHMQRSPNFDESAVLGTEYIYWSSPVASFQVTNISPSSSQLFGWTPTVGGNGAGNYGEWFGASGAMTDGTGYIVRGLGGTPATIPATAYAISSNTALFSGVPNNGIINKPIFHGNYNGGPYAGVGNTATNEDDNWNLLGNPYPSAISANAFTNLNTNINGMVYVWPHNSTYSAATIDPFYEDYVYNYDGNDYIEYNSTGSNPPGLNDYYIGAGQAFFVLMNHSATTGTNVTFNNGMRQVLSTYNNETFFRTNSSGDSTNRNNFERHRIWLDLLSPNNITNTILVGYVQNATNNFDRLFDGYDFSSGDNSGFYSVLENETLSIQGRSLPFLQEDTVPLGIIANETGSHTIAINTIDGLFITEDQSIYIEDTALNIIHDIRLSPYSFTIEAGVHNNRFILRYTNEALGVNQLDDIGDILIVAPKSEYIKVTSEIGIINSIAIYDIVGRVIFTTKDINQSEFILNETRLSDGAYIVKVQLYNGKQKIQKVVLKK